jgi:hypothetical protein
VVVETTPPAAPAIAAPRGWLAASDSAAVDIGLSTYAPHPGSGIAGYSVTRDGSEPDAAIDVPGASASYRLGQLADGATVVRARAVSGAGIAGASARAVVRVDRGSPVATLTGAGSPATAHPGSVAVTLSGRDALSGMGEAPAGDPVTAGGHVAYRLDGAAWTLVRGDEAAIAVTDAGHHTLAYYAVDAAGNRSAEQTRAILIAPGASGDPVVRGGFGARTANPRTTFTAAARFGDPCPAVASLAGARDAALGNGQTLVGFDLPAAPDCTVESARLRLYAAAASAAAPVDVARAGAAWDAATVTADTAPGSVGPAARATSPGTPGWVEWDVTAQVQALYRRGDNGLLVRSPSGAAPVAWCTRTAPPASCDGDRRPQLVVRFAP